MNTFVKMPANKKSLAMRKLIYGVGINDAWYKIEIMVDSERVVCPIYCRWFSMLERCYSSNLQKKQPTYVGCSVCEEWHRFSNFTNWMEKQDWEGRDLDKDLINPPNKAYSPEMCMFVPQAINNLMVDSGAARGKYPIGVHWHKRDRKFNALIRIHGKRKYLGSFTNPEEAHQVYLEAKHDYIISILPTLTNEDPRLIPALQRIADGLLTNTCSKQTTK